MRPIDPDKLYTDKQAAGYLGLSPNSLRRYRVMKRLGPDYIRLSNGWSIRYRGSVLIAFITTRAENAAK